jgi:hypothetical protein
MHHVAASEEQAIAEGQVSDVPGISVFMMAANLLFLPAINAPSNNLL